MKLLIDANITFINKLRLTNIVISVNNIEIPIGTWLYAVFENKKE